MASPECLSEDTCIFCRIAAKKEQGTTILHETDEFVIFRDIKPASRDHYLVVTKHHIRNPKCLEGSDLPLVERLIAEGKDFLTKTGGDIDDSRFGFHWPPFMLVNHLHLHVISPVSEMSWLASCIFKPGSFWFVTADWLLNHLKGKS